MKKCGNTKCEDKNPQPLSNFCKNKSQHDGLQNYCKKCQRMANSIYSKNNKEKCAAKARRLNKKWREQDSNKVSARKRNYRLKRTYGITSEDYELMFKNQSGCCYICNNSFDKLMVDHCHSSGKVRKLLCGNCNTLIGHCKENVDILMSAIQYLKEMK